MLVSDHTARRPPRPRVREEGAFFSAEAGRVADDAEVDRHDVEFQLRPTVDLAERPDEPTLLGILDDTGGVGMIRLRARTQLSREMDLERRYLACANGHRESGHGARIDTGRAGVVGGIPTAGLGTITLVATGLFRREMYPQ